MPYFILDIKPAPEKVTGHGFSNNTAHLKFSLTFHLFI